MEPEIMDQLTDAQKACLRLVWAHMTSKEIARKLNISRHTVDAHIKKALKLLNVSDRAKAARMLAEAESNSLLDDVCDSPADTDGYQKSTMLDRPSPCGGGDVDYSELVQKQQQRILGAAREGTAYEEYFSKMPWRSIWYAEEGGRKTGCGNNLSKSLRILIVVSTSIISITVVLMVILLMQTASSMYG